MVAYNAPGVSLAHECQSAATSETVTVAVMSLAHVSSAIASTRIFTFISTQKLEHKWVLLLLFKLTKSTLTF